MRPASDLLTVRRAWRVGAAAVLAAGGLVAVATPAAASQFTVTTTADSGVGSLRQAVLDANGNAGPDEITFDPSIDTQTITLTSGQLNVTEALTVTGNGATNTIVDGNASTRIFNVSGGVAFTISGATLQHALAATGAGGAIDSDGAVTLDATTLTDNSAPAGDGGGLHAPSATIQNGSVVRANQASASGGGVSVFGDLGVTDSTIGGSSVSDGNTAGRSGGGVLASGTATITNSTVRHNTTTGLAGAGSTHKAPS